MKRQLAPIIRADSPAAVAECTDRLLAGDIPGFAIPPSTKHDVAADPMAFKALNLEAATQIRDHTGGRFGTRYQLSTKTHGDVGPHIDFPYQYHDIDNPQPPSRLIGVHTSSSLAEVTLGVTRPKAFRSQVLASSRAMGQVIRRDYSAALEGQPYDEEKLGPIHSSVVFPGVTTVFNSLDLVGLHPSVHDFRTLGVGPRLFDNQMVVLDQSKGLQP